MLTPLTACHVVLLIFYGTKTYSLYTAPKEPIDGVAGEVNERHLWWKISSLFVCQSVNAPLLGDSPLQCCADNR